MINGEARPVTKTTQVQGTIDQPLVNQSTPKFKRHQFTMIHQQTFQSKLRQNLAPNDCMIRIHFSENYLRKSSQEVQTVKRSVWRHVKSGQTHITTPAKYAAVAKERNTNVNVEFIPSATIEAKSRELDPFWQGVFAVPRTHKMHCILPKDLIN